ncbi:MAG TPA: CinA family protein [Intrasporangium sp.]|uniref:CinA family protein n=1 Tax=Intrasporangium sp. TaxID=1925024 RepID=UPI002D7A09C5|nr:CinA family protein [Intrasporangium sp.]HET7398953.1 CinA family protein [Intrasporangium sp.]
MTPPDQVVDAAAHVAEEIAQLAQDGGATVAVAESLTGGKISCHLGAAPSSATWFRGAVVAYSKEVKFAVLQVPPGPVVTKECAAAMAGGVADLLGADAAVAVTGVGGPDDEEGQPAGTVWFGVVAGGSVTTEQRQFDGDPQEVLEATTLHALRLLRRGLQQVR